MADANTDAQELAKHALRTRTNEHTGAQKSTRAARRVRRGEWEAAYFLLYDEGLSYAEAARRLNMKASTLRMRATRDRWFQPDARGEVHVPLSDMLLERNDRQLMKVLMAMSGALDAAAQARDTEQLALALKKSELIGKFARSAQSIARACSVVANTKTKLAAQVETPAGRSRSGKFPQPTVEDAIAILDTLDAERRADPAAYGVTEADVPEEG